METLQNLLTAAIEVVAIAGFGGIALHAIWSSHCKWMNEYCPAVEELAVEPVIEEPAVEPAVEELAVEPVIEEPAVEPVIEEPAVEPVIEELAVEPVIEELAVEPVIEELAVESLLSKYQAMNVERLRKECRIHSIDWRGGGDYGKPMKKNQMIRALTA
jgi:hypothetical protein